MGVSFRKGPVPHVFEYFYRRSAAFQASGSCEGDWMKRLSLFLICLAFLLLRPSPSWSQAGMPSGARSGGNTEIVVQVRNPDGNAAPTGIHLRLEIAGKGSALDCTTDGSGQCRFVPGGAGRYVARVKQFGYKETSVEIDLVDILQAYVPLLARLARPA